VLPGSFVARGKEDAAYEVAQAQALSVAARAAGVTHEVVRRRLGSAPPRPWAAQPLRVVRGATDKGHPDGTPVELGLVTTRVALAADVSALAYR